MNSDSQQPESGHAKLRLAAARHRLDLLPSSELPVLAISVLEAGCDSPSLRELAGELHPTWADTGPLFERVLQELGIQFLRREDSAETVARFYAQQILAGEFTPCEGARHIWREVANQYSHDDELWKRYSIFVGLASQWEDEPSGRVEYERRIREEAQRLLRSAD